jgi:hypothetical protein
MTNPWYHPGMAQRALFGGLVIDEYGAPVGVKQIGDEAFYVINDDGFLRHVESEKVDRQVLEQMRELIQGHEDLISQGTMEMIGQEDIFTRAMIESSLRDLDAQFDRLIATGLPEEGRAWLGMLGFQVVVNVHGDVVRVEQPSGPEEPPE